MIKITIPILDHHYPFLTPEGQPNETAYYFVEYKLQQDDVYKSFQAFATPIVINMLKRDSIYNVRITRYALRGGFVSNPVCIDINTSIP